MLKIASILNHVLKNISTERYQVIDDEHVIDTHTGAKYHLYDNWFKVTHGDKTVIAMSEFAPEEHKIIWQIKQTITDPVKAKQRYEEYPAMVKERRQSFSKLYEEPMPIPSTHPIIEDDAEEYIG